MNRRRAFRLLCLATFTTVAAGRESLADTEPVEQMLMFDAKDFALTLARNLPDEMTPLSQSALETAFGSARCHCPSALLATLQLTETGLAKLKQSSRRSLEAQLMVGNDCDKDATPTAQCPTIAGSLTVSTEKPGTEQTLSTSELYTGAYGGTAPDCTKLTAITTKIWAVVRHGGTRVANPSLLFKIGESKPPEAPSGVAALVAEGGLLVSWKEPAKTDGIRGYQVLCAPGKTQPNRPAYESCPEALAGAGSGLFDKLPEAFVCSGLVDVGKTSERLAGLENGRTYTLAVIAVRADGTPSLPSMVATGVPGPTVGFFERYQAQGGAAEAGCSLGQRPRAGGVGLAVLTLLLMAIRKRRRLAAVFGLAALLAVALPGTAQARDSELGESASDRYESPHHWNFELRFGPYRPDIDGELQSRGVAATPFRDTFSSKRRLMTQLEIDRQILDRGGSLAIGFTAGQYRATAPALAADGKTPSGDETSLLLVPLSVSLVYRASFLERRFEIPFVPFAKLGLDYTYWSVGHTGRSEDTSGGTPGWHAAAGVAMYLDFLDPEAANTLDNDAGVNHTALFVEVTRYRLDGFGAAKKLRLSDTTWFAGLMLEM